jgi:hypothetical protein
MYQDINVKESSGWSTEQMPTLDYLAQQNFRLSIPYCPAMSQTATKISVPKVSIGSTTQMTPNFDVPRIGDSVFMGTFTASFPVLDDLSNYLEVFNWMHYIVNSELVDQYDLVNTIQRLEASGIGNGTGAINDSKFYCDGSVVLCSRSNEPKLEIKMLGMIPTAISGIDLDALTTSTAPIYATATFAYMYHNINPLKK